MKEIKEKRKEKEKVIRISSVVIGGETRLSLKQAT